MDTSTTTVKIDPISVARGNMKMSVIPDTAVPIYRTVRNMLHHTEYKYVWSVELVGSIGNSKPSILRSPIFELIPNKISPLFKDNHWYFEIVLNPCDDEVSLFLCSKGIDFSCNKANHFNLCFEAGLYNEQGNEFIVAKASGVEQINGDTNGLGWKNLCSYKCIKNAPSLHLRATIWTLGELKEGDSDLSPKKELSLTPDSGRHSIVNDIASLWHEKRSEWTDMVIHIGYRSFPVHRAILAARSRFFHELFKKHRDEDLCPKNSIRLDGVDLECMERILEYVYTGHIGTSETQKLTDLLELADKLQVSSCKTECFHRLSERLTLQNALSLAVMSYKFNVCTELKNRVKKFCLFVIQFNFRKMVRFRYSGLKLKENKLFLPDYDTKWAEWQPDGTCKEKTWVDAWEKEKGRDFVHRVNSKYIARYTKIGEEPGQTGNYSTFATIVCFVIVACIIVPQVLQIFSVLCFPSARHLPSPPSPPPVPKSRKRLKLYHFRHTVRRKLPLHKA